MAGNNIMSRSDFDQFVKVVSGMASNFKAKLEALRAASGGVSIADMLAIQYDSNFMNMMVDTAGSLSKALESMSKSISQKI